MARHPNQTRGYAGHPRQAANHMNGHTDEATAREEAAKLDALPKMLKPPHRHVWVNGVCKVCNAKERDWRLRVDLHGIQTCGECGRSIMPKTDFMRDAVSGHMNRHVECHERAEAGQR